MQHAFSIYNASAGAGKTYTLVKEYLKIILLSKKPDTYRNILAITFTNKAVHEMKTRVINSLYEFTNENLSKKTQDLLEHISSETNLSEEEIRQKAQEIIKHLIHNYAAFDISTIDKFTHRVIRSFAHDLNLPITFEVSLDTDALLTEAVDAIISQAGNDEVLTQLLIDFTIEKADDDKSWDVSRDIFNVGKLIVNENNQEEIAHFNKKTISEFIEIKNKLKEYCKQFEAETIKQATEMLALIDKNGIDLKSFSNEYFPKHLISIQEARFNPSNKTYHEFEDIKINKTAKDKAVIESIIPQLLETLQQVYYKLERKNFYEAFLRNITPLSLMNTLSNKLQDIQKEQNILSIAEFNKLINEQIKNQPAPFIYERMGEKYRHFFIDEFQDTSQLQWENLIPLINNALAGETLQGEKGSLLLVGDPKQSIYRWRGGKAEQFIELTKDKNPFSNPDKKTIPLDTNYRSYSQIIDFNNQFFKWISSEFENEDYHKLYKENSFQKNNDKKGGYVNISFLPKQEKAELDEEELEQGSPFLLATLNTIKKAKTNGFNYSDIVVLVRKNEQGTLLANYLTENSIPVISSESLLLSASSEVQFIVDFLRYLDNNSNLESKAKTLYFIAKNLQNQLPLHDFIATGMKFENESQLEQWLQQFQIQLSFQSYRKKSLYEATEIIVNKTITPLFKEGNAYVQYFLDQVLEHDFKKQTGISDFLNYWDNKINKLSIPLPEGNDAIKIMTIHKAKGLEFPVVIFPFANTNYSKSPSDKMWLNANENEIGISKTLVAKNKSVLNFGEENALIFKQKAQEELLDNINILYVALTRAEEQLYIISEQVTTNKDGNFPNTMASFFKRFLIDKNISAEEIEYEEGNPKRISKQEKNENLAQNLPQVDHLLDFKNIKIAQRESVMWNTKQQAAIEFGNTIHEILSFIKTKEDITYAIKKALENGLITTQQEQEVVNTINQIVNHPELSCYFLAENNIMNEQSIIQKNDYLIKPDRISISKNNEVFLLDYKTGLPLTKHKNQLENYKNAIESMGYKVTKKALVYIGEKVEVTHLNT